MCSEKFTSNIYDKNNPITRGKRLEIIECTRPVITPAGGGEWFFVGSDLSIVRRDDYALAGVNPVILLTIAKRKSEG